MQKVELVDIIEKPISGEWGEDDYVGNGKFVLRTTNFTNEGVINYSNVVTRAINKIHLENKYLRDGDILIEKSGGSDKQPVGRVVYFDGKPNTYLFNNFTSLLRVKEKKASKRYVFYFLFYNYLNGKTRAFQNKTTGLHNLKLEPYLRSLKLLLPPIEEQKAIAEQLDKVSSLIEKRKQQFSVLDTLVKSKFVEMFGDPEINPHRFKKVTINDVCESIVRGPFGSSLKKEFFVEKGDKSYKVYEQKHAIQKSATIGTYYIDETKFKELSRFECKAGDFLMSCSGTMGEIYQLPENCERGIINQALCKFTLNKKITPVYFLVFMKQTIGKLETKGSGIKNIAAVSYVKTMPVILPPIGLQTQFTAFVERVDNLKAKIKQSLSALELLKKSLMQKYFG